MGFIEDIAFRGRFKLALSSFLALLAAWAPLIGCDDKARKVDHEAEADAAVRHDFAVDGAAPDGQPPDHGPAVDAFVPFSTAPCEARGGMVGVPFPDGTCYLMDARPVSQGDFFEVVEGAPLVSNHPACADAAPGTGPRSNYVRGVVDDPPPRHSACYFRHPGQENPQGYDQRLPWPPEGDAAMAPMVCVTWCDADAYCERAGKRLCGVNVAIPSDRYAFDEASSPQKSEIINACTGGGRTAYPYGATQPHLPEIPDWCGGGGAESIFWLSDPNCPDWMGAHEGVWGLGRTTEFIGPWAWAISVHDLYYAREPNREIQQGCQVATDEEYRIYTERMEDAKDAHYSGVTTFRCCADYDTFE